MTSTGNTAALEPPSRQAPHPSEWVLAYRLARRELRGGINGFRVFLACLALGVAAIAAVGSLSQGLLSGLQHDGRAILGGDVELRLIHRIATPEQRDWLSAKASRLSEVVELRSMARTQSGERRLVELKAVDQAYPLFGEARSAPAGPLAQLLSQRGGRWGALLEPSLFELLELEKGALLKIGSLEYEVRGRLEAEPDRATRAFILGPRVMVALDSLEQTGLIQPGSLIYDHLRIDLPPGVAVDAWREELTAAFPQAGWRIRDTRNAAAGLSRFIARLTLFMTLVGLTSLLVGGVGIANAVQSYLSGKRPTIATLKTLGAGGSLIFRTYLLQVLAIAALGIGAGLILGAMVQPLAAPLLAERFNFTVPAAVYPASLAIAATFGFLVTLAFSLWPLARTRGITAAALFRDLVAPTRARASWRVMAAILASVLAIAALAALSGDRPLFTLGFIAGAIASLAVFRLSALGVMALAARLPRPRRPSLRLALANLHRPGASTPAVVTSLGLGLTVLVAVVLIEGNLTGQVSESLPERAPGFFFIDLQPDQVAAFEALVARHPGVRSMERVPMLRGRIAAVKGVRPEDMAIPEEVAWVFRGDRGLTWRRERPADARLVAGDWWPPNYSGKPLVSLDAEVGHALGLRPGDSLTINLLGRDLEVEIANLRVIDWSDLSINFVMIFSPGLLENAPQTQMATVELDRDQEVALERAVTDAFPNVSAIRVREALKRVAEVLGKIAIAVQATASVTLLSGILVLAGAIAAGHRRRVYDAVVLKVLGATRPAIAKAFLIEHGLLGLITAFLAAVIGSLAGWVVVEWVMGAEFTLLSGRVVVTALLAGVFTLAIGFAGTWRALSVKPAPLLRNE